MFLMLTSNSVYIKILFYLYGVNYELIKNNY